jgi:iron complex transport system substrate-binding protein
MSDAMRICSFLPSATEILFALGLGDSVAGVTYECDYPAEARLKPVIVFSNLQPALLEREIDREVKDSSATGQSLYRLDAEKLRAIAPDLIITQDLCQVCAASPNDLAAVLAGLEPCPEVLCLNSHTVAEVLNDVLKVGIATGCAGEAQELVARLRQQIASARSVASADAPRVLCLEWLDPPFVAGHWVPEMVALAGGVDALGKVGEHGYEVDWQTITATDPDMILAMPCGFHTPEVEAELKKSPFPPEWHALRAVREKRVFAVDASSYFSRPGPRIAEGVEVLADLFRRIQKPVRHNNC